MYIPMAAASATQQTYEGSLTHQQFSFSSTQNPGYDVVIRAETKCELA